jgi:SAM-dependent methyltransferase
MNLKTLKNRVKNIPVLGSISRGIYSKFRAITFNGSENYWIDRYQKGRDSGAGSFNKLARFKADILNDFVKTNAIDFVIEYGCGDSNQLQLAEYPRYLGLDISRKAIELCRKQFAGDKNKIFKLMSDYAGEKADLTLSLDVVYHLIEDEVFAEYMALLFSSAKSFVIIYSSDTNEQLHSGQPHVKHRKFSDWVKTHITDWQLMAHIPNKYPYHGNLHEGSWADFYMYKHL